MTIITEQEFSERLRAILAPFRGQVKSVSGPGRSGAVASVYASHYLGAIWLPYNSEVKPHLRPHMVIDTATESGATLRKASRRMTADLSLAIFPEPPRVRFWYEV